MSHRLRLVTVAGGVALAAAALALRVRARQQGLIYPDGYQYLLMARGIGAHLTPTVRLGNGGEMFVPSLDAALKPLFPALVALLSPLTGARAAADGIASVAGAATVVLAGILAGRLTGSRAAAAVAFTAALVSPALVYWSGFAGPDPLAEALALAAALAALERRAALAGVLGALCAATRPEWGLLCAAVTLAAVARPSTRALARRSLVSGAFTLAALLVLLRPPLGVPAGGPWLLIGALLAGTGLQLGAHWAAATPRRATIVGAATMAAVPALALLGHAQALSGLLRSEWPLLALAAWGVLRACRAGRGRPALMLLAAMVLLGSIYAYRNAGSERYLAQLLPLVCVAAGLAAAPFGQVLARAHILRLALPAATILLVPLVGADRTKLGTDTFAALASGLSRAPAGVMFSAAPDAYGFLLPDRPQQTLRSGARGLILLDGAQRTYSPGLTARGVVVARLAAPTGFERPDGVLDTAPAVLVRGVAVPASAPPVRGVAAPASPLTAPASALTAQSSPYPSSPARR